MWPNEVPVFSCTALCARLCVCECVCVCVCVCLCVCVSVSVSMYVANGLFFFTFHTQMTHPRPSLIGTVAATPALRRRDPFRHNWQRCKNVRALAWCTVWDCVHFFFFSRFSTASGQGSHSVQALHTARRSIDSALKVCHLFLFVCLFVCLFVFFLRKYFFIIRRNASDFIVLYT